MEEMQNRNQHPVESDEFSDFADKFDKTLALEESSSSTAGRAENGGESEKLSLRATTTHEIDNEEEDDENEEEEENEEFEFFFFGETLKSPVSAEEVFEDGQIRIIAPFSGEGEEAAATTSYRPPVKNYFVVSNSPENDDVAEEGAYCVWKSPTPEMSKKSNSTGFSKFRKMRDLLARSNSDGKDAFVFLNGKSEETTSLKKENKKKKEKVKLEKLDVGKKKEKEEGETTAFGGERKEKEKKKKKKSAYEVLYGGEKKKGGGKSYLPYRQDLVGFFTNGSGMSRNVHPY